MQNAKEGSKQCPKSNKRATNIISEFIVKIWKTHAIKKHEEKKFLNYSD